MSKDIQVSIDELIQLRHELHRFPELSGEEKETAGRIVDYLKNFEPDEIITGLGGFGVAAVFNGESDGPTVMIRSELDALSISESMDIEYNSENDGVSHKCGHDGHMTMVAGLAPMLKENPPQSGRVVLLFQGAEETGEGAKAILEDPKFKAIDPDWIFALHNLPNYPLHQIMLKDGLFNPGVNSLIVKYTGATSHAGQPHKGRNPAFAMAELLQALNEWNDHPDDSEVFTMVTPVYQQMGEKAYGVSAGEGEIHFTIRCERTERLKQLEKQAESLARSIGEQHDLETEISWTEEFFSSYNAPEAVNHLRAVAKDLGLEVDEKEYSFRWGEDFGLFTQHHRGAMFCLGGGENRWALHHQDYDFNDEILETGIRMYFGIIQRILNV